MLAAVHRCPRRNRLFPSRRVHKRRKYRRSSICKWSRRRNLYKPKLHLRCMPALCHRLCWSLRAISSTWPRSVVHIVDGNAQSQCSATAHGGYGAVASAIPERRKPARSEEHADAAPASIALNSSAATTQRVYCYAVASRAAQVQKNYGLLRIATSQENLYVAHAPLATSSCANAHMQQVKERVIECTRSGTLASRADEQIIILNYVSPIIKFADLHKACQTPKGGGRKCPVAPPSGCATV